MENQSYLTAIILAAGSGNRMGADTTKQKMNICGKSLLWHSVKAFSDCLHVNSIVIVSKSDEMDWARAELSEFSKIEAVVAGGNTRAESARLGFAAVSNKSGFVAVHDGARCLIRPRDIDAVINAAFVHGAATAAASVTDTLKYSDDGFIKNTVSRSNLFSAQTPQVFKAELYGKALAASEADDSVTDDNMMMEKIGINVAVVITGKHNIKITTGDDLDYAEYILSGGGRMTEIRTGHGYDVHRFAEGRRLILGGVDIPYEKGLLGHSDADVLVHAIMDSLLGACGLGDIGRHFPDSSREFKDISSLVLLARVKELVNNNGFEIVNIDATLVMQKPKIAEYIDKMTNNVAEILKIDRSRINIKATTEEHLGFTGRMEGVSAHSVANVKTKG